MTDILMLEQQVRRNRRSLDQQVGQLKALVVQAKELQSSISEGKELVEVVEQVVGLLNSIGEERQDFAQRQIEALVTKGLQTIFEENLSFHVISSTKNNAAHVSFIVRTHKDDGTFLDTSVMDARGGGLSSIVGFLLRVVYLLLSKESRVLILDETFAAVSDEYETRLADFLRELVDKAGLQVILVTHSNAFSDVADVVYRTSLVQGKTKLV